MAIADGMAINCSDLQAVGGTRLIAIREWVSTDIVVFNDTPHDITSIQGVGPVAATWGVFESRIESSSLTVAATTTPSAAFASNKVIGLSNTLPNQDNAARTQQYATLASIDGGTGTAFSDEIGVTVTITCRSFETPRNYAGTIALDADGLGLTTTV